MTGPSGLPFQRDRDQLADLYAAVDLAVAPGPAETFGLASVEALASGNPVLSVDQGGVAETVTRSGAGDAIRVRRCRPPGRGGGAAPRLGPPSLGSLARRYAESHHSWSAVFDRLFSVYRSVLAR